MDLKYGMNPYQKNASINKIDGNLTLLAGSPSYINFLDALNAWQLVKEASKVLGLPTATSFKHVSPSGVAVAKALTQEERNSYYCDDQELSPLATAYLRARGSDRLASFGDFIALSGKVDLNTAQIIKKEVSDGIIAPDFDSQALEVLKSKKNGKYVILKINPDYTPPVSESRDVFGFALIQDRNNLKIDQTMLNDVKTQIKEVPQNIKNDLVLGLTTLKYTQSNSISLTYNGQVIGIGAGQQSRILCTDLAGKKAIKWYQKSKINPRDFPEIQDLNRTGKDLFIESHLSTSESGSLNGLSGVGLCSDAFFPQIDNILLAHKIGVKYIAAPVGSINDDLIIQECNRLGICFIAVPDRLFHH